MLRKHNSKLQNSPNFRQFSAADLNISRDSRAGFFLKRAQDVPNYSSIADNFLVESKTVADLLSKLRKNKFKNLSNLITYLVHKLKILLKFPRKIPCTLDFSCVQFLTAIFLQLGPWNLLMMPRLMPQDPRDVPDYPADKRRPAP
jgi:hypothetical protein